MYLSSVCQHLNTGRICYYIYCTFLLFHMYLHQLIAQNYKRQILHRRGCSYCLAQSDFVHSRQRWSSLFYRAKKMLKIAALVSLVVACYAQPPEPVRPYLPATFYGKVAITIGYSYTLQCPRLFSLTYPVPCMDEHHRSLRTHRAYWSR